MKVSRNFTSYFLRDFLGSPKGKYRVLKIKLLVTLKRVV